MSRIGNKPLLLPAGITISVEGNILRVAGKNGESKLQIPRELAVHQHEGTVTVERRSLSRQARAMHGTIRRLLENAVKGCDEDFQKKLELVGLGYRSQVTDNQLTLQVGFTHPVVLEIPANIKISVEKNVITVSGIDKHAVGQFAAKIREVKKPEPYKGKGIRYVGEVVKLKQGKATKGA